MVDLHVFQSPEDLAAALADFVARDLEARLAIADHASLALSGGRTPARFLEQLSQRELPWSRVQVGLVDDRCVPPDSPRSNAGLVRRHLLRNRAADALFHPLLDAPPESLPAWLPPGIAVLGMGDDGHTASWFPHGEGLADALATAEGRLVAQTRAPDGEARVTLTLGAVLAAGTLVLHIEGEAKRAVFERAAQGGAVEDMPVRAVLQPGRDISVFWSP
jgi:6-phosphogluconolactonase